MIMSRQAAIHFLLIIVFLFILTCCTISAPKEVVLYDFEADEELDRLHWTCHTLYSLSDHYATHGLKSLQIELYPSDYPGLTPMLKQNDWSNYNFFRFDVYNPQENDLSLSVRIDDRKSYPDYKDRFNKSFILNPGMNHIRIPLDTLVTSGKGKNLNLNTIYRVYIFMSHPTKKVILYFDYVKLV